MDGFGLIKTNVDNYGIHCDYQEKTGYLYAENEDEVKLLADILDGAVKVGVPVDYVDEVPTPVPFQKALAWAGQAQFHPLKYAQGLVKAYETAGGLVLDNTRIETVDSADGVHTAAGVKARAVIYATHMPPNINVFNFECAPYRSYVLAVKLKSGKYPDALIYDSQEPYHYVRTHVIDEEEYYWSAGSTIKPVMMTRRKLSLTWRNMYGNTTMFLRLSTAGQVNTTCRWTGCPI